MKTICPSPVLGLANRRKRTAAAMVDGCLDRGPSVIAITTMVKIERTNLPESVKQTYRFLADKTSNR